MKSWDGHQQQTLIMEISSSLEWDMLLTGAKTEMRSPHPLLDPEVEAPSLVMLHHGGKYAPFVIVDMWQEELVDVNELDSKSEGFDSLASFKRHWCAKTGAAYFSQFERVWGYEFTNEWSPDDFVRDFMKPGADKNPHTKAILKLVDSLYPTSMS